eukprot:g662.t1
MDVPPYILSSPLPLLAVVDARPSKESNSSAEPNSSLAPPSHTLALQVCAALEVSHSAARHLFPPSLLFSLIDIGQDNKAGKEVKNGFHSYLKAGLDKKYQVQLHRLVKTSLSDTHDPDFAKAILASQSISFTNTGGPMRVRLLSSKQLSNSAQPLLTADNIDVSLCPKSSQNRTSSNANASTTRTASSLSQSTTPMAAATSSVHSTNLETTTDSLTSESQHHRRTGSSSNELIFPSTGIVSSRWFLKHRSVLPVVCVVVMHLTKAMCGLMSTPNTGGGTFEWSEKASSDWQELEESTMQAVLHLRAQLLGRNVQMYLMVIRNDALQTPNELKPETKERRHERINAIDKRIRTFRKSIGIDSRHLLQFQEPQFEMYYQYMIQSCLPEPIRVRLLSSNLKKKKGQQNTTTEYQQQYLQQQANIFRPIFGKVRRTLYDAAIEIYKSESRKVRSLKKKFTLITASNSSSNSATNTHGRGALVTKMKQDEERIVLAREYFKAAHFRETAIPLLTLKSKEKAYHEKTTKVMAQATPPPHDASLSSSTTNNGSYDPLLAAASPRPQGSLSPGRPQEGRQDNPNLTSPSQNANPSESSGANPNINRDVSQNHHQQQSTPKAVVNHSVNTPQQIGTVHNTSSTAKTELEKVIGLYENCFQTLAPMVTTVVNDQRDHQGAGGQQDLNSSASIEISIEEVKVFAHLVSLKLCYLFLFPPAGRPRVGRAILQYRRLIDAFESKRSDNTIFGTLLKRQSGKEQKSEQGSEQGSAEKCVLSELESKLIEQDSFWKSHKINQLEQMSVMAVQGSELNTRQTVNIMRCLTNGALLKCIQWGWAAKAAMTFGELLELFLDTPNYSSLVTSAHLSDVPGQVWLNPPHYFSQAASYAIERRTLARQIGFYTTENMHTTVQSSAAAATRATVENPTLGTSPLHGSTLAEQYSCVDITNGDLFPKEALTGSNSLLQSVKWEFSFLSKLPKGGEYIRSPETRTIYGPALFLQACREELAFPHSGTIIALLQRSLMSATGPHERCYFEYWIAKEQHIAGNLRQ